MTDVQYALQAFLPSKRKQTPSGWISFDAPCCFRRGESKDTRQRGGVLLNNKGGFQYHCFNCQFKAGWSQGHSLSEHTKSLFKWLGMSDDEINKLILLTLKDKELTNKELPQLNFEFNSVQLPENTKLLTTWEKIKLEDQELENLLSIKEYIKQRGFELDWYPWHWSTTNGYTDRLIIPFYYDKKIVGWTGRKITPGKPKYLTHSQPGYVFNLDSQHYNRKYLIVVEGQFDAIAVDGVAIMHNNPSDVQCARINALGKEVIVVPDKDRAGSKIIDAALKNNWTVSLPPWEDDIKDVADAVKRYGRIYTLFTILHYKEKNKIKIELLKRKLEALNG